MEHLKHSPPPPSPLQLLSLINQGLSTWEAAYGAKVQLGQSLRVFFYPCQRTEKPGPLQSPHPTVGWPEYKMPLHCKTSERDQTGQSSLCLWGMRRSSSNFHPRCWNSELPSAAGIITISSSIPRSQTKQESIPFHPS